MAKQSLGIIGTGAFGAFMARHLSPHFTLLLHDAQKDCRALAKECGGTAANLWQTAACDVVILAVPVQQFEKVLKDIAGFVKPEALVTDVGSVKVKPAELMKALLPASVDCVGTHPLFGPQSGKNGIAGLNIALCDVRGRRGDCVSRFLEEQLKLKVFRVTPEDHDKQMAYVQGLTHLIAKVITLLDLPSFQLTTKTFEHLQTMVEMIRYDSDELFRAIARENPYAAEAKARFFAAARQLEEKLAEK